MKRPLVPCICALALCSATLFAKSDPAEESIRGQLRKMSDELSATDGFSDEDAIKVAIFLLEKMEGGPMPYEKLFAQVVPSKPGYVKVLAAYDQGLKFRAYEFEFFRGENKTFGFFVSMIHVPSQ